MAMVSAYLIGCLHLRKSKNVNKCIWTPESNASARIDFIYATE